MQSMHVIERTAAFHLIFETIQPFIDGNGRVGRLLLNFELMKEGYPPINIKFSDRQKYFECFNHYRDGNNDISLMAGLVEGYAIEELRRYIEIAEESDRLREGFPGDIHGGFKYEKKRLDINQVNTGCLSCGQQSVVLVRSYRSCR